MTNEPSHHSHEGAHAGSFWASRAFLAFLGFAAMAVVLLWSEHRAHILGAPPFLFLLACPLLHIFMHGGHGAHQGLSPDQRAGRDPSQADGRNS